MIVPDPLRFTRRALEARGGLVDPDEGGLSALLPLPVARELSLPEAVELGLHGDGGRVPCGIGSPLLEALVEEGRRHAPITALQVGGRAPVAAARSLAASYVIRNGVSTVGLVSASEAWYLRVALAWRVEADERHEGVVLASVCPQDGALPAEDAAAGWLPGALDAEPATPPDPAGAPTWVARLAPRVVNPVAVPLLALVTRREEREHARLVAYYGAMITETARPRRKVDPSSLKAKLDHLVAERDSRLADLAHRYGARISVRLAGALWARVPVATVALSARRRKGQRELILRLPAGARTFDRLPCAGCDGWTDRPALCDDRLHVLCETCAPESTGRPRCGAC